MGGNGIPGSGIVKTLVLVQALGLPVELVGIVAAFYRVFDMGMTTNNCLGDLVGTVIVSRLESRREAKAASKSS
jgi:Na+/H+-dicarboxylate symporter